MRKLLVATLVVGAVSVMGTEAMAQSDTDSAVANATIIAPIVISNTAPLEFGDVISGASLGTVVIATDGARSKTGGTTLGSRGATVSAAAFTVTGALDYTYAITLPTSITISDGTNLMTVGAFNSDPTVATGGNLGGGGTQPLAVGATLNVGGAQAAGSYTGSFPVTVTYN